MKTLIAKILCVAMMLLVSQHIYGQTGIGTQNPHTSSALEVSSANRGVLIPRISLLSTKDVTTIPNPGNSLLVYNTATAGVSPDNVTPNCYYFNQTTATWIRLITNISLNAELDKIGMPQSAVFQLKTNITNFLNGTTSGNLQNVPMAELSNTVKDNAVVFNSTTNTITFKPGNYEITFVYEANHNLAGCSVSSYFVNFPTGTGTFTPVHTNGSHAQGVPVTSEIGSHGGTLRFTSKIDSDADWIIQMGRGPGGNCSGTGNTLIAEATHVSIVRYK